MVNLKGGQSNLTTGRIAAALGRFTGIRQVAPTCAVSIHASLGPPEFSTQRHLDQFGRFCIAHGRVSLYFTMSLAFPLQIAASYG